MVLPQTNRDADGRDPHRAHAAGGPGGAVAPAGPAVINTPAALADFRGAAPITNATLARLAGDNLLKQLSARQREDLRLKLWVLRLRRAFRRARGAARGESDKLDAELVAAISTECGRRLSVRTLRAWRRAYRAGGAVALVDWRGRRGGGAVDPLLVAAFGRALTRGATVEVAHAVTLRRALREGRNWPRSVRTVRRWFVAIRDAVDGPLTDPHAGDYLTSSANTN